MPRIAKETPWYGRRKGSQTFYAFWYDKAAREVKRLSLGTQNPNEAKARFATFLSEGQAFLQPNPGGLTVGQALDQYWENHVLEKCTDTVRQQYCIKALRNFFGETLLAEIDIPMSRLYAEHRRGQGASDSTIRRELGTLVAASNHARKWKRIAAHEMPSIELTKQRLLGQDDQAPFYTKAQITALFEAAEGEFRHFLELLYWTGARRQSIAELEWAQVLWDQNIILLQKPGRRTTKKRRPIVPILTEMHPALVELKRLNGHREKMFTLPGQRLYRKFKDLTKKLGLAGHPHWLRHSRATHLLQDGVSLYAVARLLGDTVATVERVYGHHSHEFLARQIGGVAQDTLSSPLAG
jgi:integrase